MLIFSLDTKKCMNALLLHPAFDSFLFIEGDITTFNTFHFNGRLKKDFFSAEENEALDASARSSLLDMQPFRRTFLGSPLAWRRIQLRRYASFRHKALRVGIGQ